jgi:hypothetical protein
MSDEKNLPLKFSLIHIDAGEWSKSANTLIEKCADGIAAIARPMQIVRIAKAEVEAEKIYAIGQTEVEKIQRRALTRFIAEETKKQHNMESIVTKALPDVSDTAKPENIEDDWIANFFDKCRLISDDDMQKLWARILAGEANTPGKFSKRTVGLLASMDKSDATKFTKVCDFVCKIEAEIVPVIFDFSIPIYSQLGLSYALLSHLDTIGLIRFDQTPKHFFSVDELSQHTVVRYFDQEIFIMFPSSPTNPPPSKHELWVGQVIFTDAGQQLANICDAKPVTGFVEFLKERWTSVVAPRSAGPFGPPQF